MKKLTLAAGILLASSGAAWAGSCDAPKTGFDNVYCFAKVYMDLDRQLNDNYAALMRQIGPAQKAALREGQRGWIGVRDAKCYAADGKANRLNIDCALTTTRRRIQFLSDRLAECRATGCNPGKLGLVSETRDD